jgi:hypothetical protein
MRVSGIIVMFAGVMLKVEGGGLRGSKYATRPFHQLIVLMFFFFFFPEHQVFLTECTTVQN